MTRLVKFTEAKTKKPDTYLIDPEQVGVVLPRKSYTTVLVQGRYFHVSDLLDVTLQKLGFAAEVL